MSASPREKEIAEVAARLFLNGLRFQRAGGHADSSGGYYVSMGHKLGYIPDSADEEAIRMTLESAMKE